MPNLKRMNEVDRFYCQTYFCPITGCWIWVGTLTQWGYGKFSTSHRKDHAAHRWSYEHFVGPIPEGLVIDHLKCNNKRCVNPDHMRTATLFENTIRGDCPSSINLAKRNCPKCGGEYRNIENSRRQCYPCKLANNRRWNKAKREARLAAQD